MFLTFLKIVNPNLVKALLNSHGKKERTFLNNSFSPIFSKLNFFNFSKGFGLFEMVTVPCHFPAKERDIFWFRFDLRIKNNSGLEAALSKSPPPILIFCSDPNVMGKLGNKKRKFLIESINDIKTQLRIKKIPFITRDGLPEHIIPSFVKEFNSRSVFYSINPFFEKDFELHKRLIEKCYTSGAKPMIFFKDSLLSLEKNFLKQPLYFSSFSKFLKNSNPTLDDLSFSEISDNYSAKDYISSKFTPYSTFHQNFNAINEELLIGGEVFILSTLKNLGGLNEPDKNRLNRNFFKIFKPWLDTGCITPKTLFFYLSKRNLTETNTLVFNLFFNDYQFFTQVASQKKIIRELKNNNFQGFFF